MNLFEINEEINAILKNVMTENGEIDEEKMVELDRLQLDRQTKITNLACYLQNVGAELEAVKEQKKRFADREKSLQKEHDRIVEYINSTMQLGEQIKDDRVVVKINKTPASVKIIDEAKIPKKYWKKIIEKEISKSSIADIFKSGKIVRGCKYESGTRVSIK